MHKVRVWVELPDDKFRGYVIESRRMGVTVEQLVEGVVRNLLDEAEQASHDGTDHPVFLE